LKDLSSHHFVQNNTGGPDIAAEPNSVLIGLIYLLLKKNMISVRVTCSGLLTGGVYSGVHRHNVSPVQSSLVPTGQAFHRFWLNISGGRGKASPKSAS
jgi:hypothetical protein